VLNGVDQGLLHHNEALIYLREDPDRVRAHAERMLARAERRSHQALKLVDKWKLRIAALDRVGIAARQATFWSEEQPEREVQPDTLAV
jgi:hypothetical protein